MNYREDELSSCPSSGSAYSSELGAELRRLWMAMTHDRQQPASLEGLQRQQFWVLGAVQQGARRMSDLAESAQTSQTSLTGIVDRLEERGLVQRTRSDADRRVVQVELTAHGREVMEAANCAYVARLEHLLEPLGPAERDELLRILRKITANRGIRA